jgi:hypothetical protein
MKATEYLEAAKVEEVAAHLRRQGYDVDASPAGADEGYDLLARKADRKVAVLVKAQSELREAAAEIAKLREQALRDGYDEFRLVVVNPPHEKTVEIEGLSNLLTEYMTNHFPGELDQLSSHALIESVSGVEADSVEIGKDGIRVRGSGIVDVALQDAGGEDRDGITSHTDFPFRFDVLLNHDREIEQAHLDVDTSRFNE